MLILWWVAPTVQEDRTMEIRRVAVIYDDRARPDTTGVYCRRALETLVETVHYRPDELESIPREGFDLYLNIDDGLRYDLPEELHPCAWWAVDTHLTLDWYVQRGGHFDVVFAAQCDGAELLRKAGIDSARWLPLACDPEIHRKHEVARSYDVAFVGNLFPGPRTELLNLVRQQVPAFVHRQRLLRGDGPRVLRGVERPSTGASATTSTCVSSRRWPAARCC